MVENVFLCVGRFEGHSLLARRLLKRNTQLEQLQDDVAEVLEEEVVVLGVSLDEWTHLWKEC